jgi:hypothetical protein
MVEFQLWNDDRGGDRRISFHPDQVVYYRAVEQKVLFGGYDSCTKIVLETGESFVVTSPYDVVRRVLEQAKEKGR